jgi:hypothetical protein
MMMIWAQWRWPPVVTVLLLLSTAVTPALGAPPPAAPPPPSLCTLRQPTAVVLGGDDAGTGAAWALSSLGVHTLLVLTHRRDLGGDPSSFYHDGGHMVRTGGGLNDLLLSSVPLGDHSEQRGGNANVAGGPGAAFLFFDTLLRSAPLNRSLEIIEGYVALPGSGQLDTATGAISSLSLLHRNGSMCTVKCRYAIDGTPEGYGAAAFGLPIVFGRERWHNQSIDPDDDPTTRAEAYAGRRTFTTVPHHGPPVDLWSDKSVEREDTSSGVGPILNLCQYSSALDEQIAPSAPWLLTSAPAGYRDADFAAAAGSGVRPYLDGNCCPAAPPPQGCAPEVVYRYQGLSLSTRYAHKTGCSGPSLPRWYELASIPEAGEGERGERGGRRPSTRQHYLRRSYAQPADVWRLKREVEVRAWYWPVGGLWYLQNHVVGGRGWGFCNSSFPKTNPSLVAQGRADDADIPAGPYTLADFNTSTHMGDQTVAFRLYHRELARLGSTRPVGAALLYDGEARQALPPPLGNNRADDAGLAATALHSQQRSCNTKKYWEPAAVVFALYGTDFTKGVLGGTVPLPSNRSGGEGVLAGNGPSCGNMHGMTRSLLTPDHTATPQALRSGQFPPSGVFQRSFVENFLSPGTPRSTFMLQSSARIGCFASNIGVAAGAIVAMSERHGLGNASAVPTMVAQWALGAELSTAITYFAPPLRSAQRQGGHLSPRTYAALHIAGAFAVPPMLDVGNVSAGAVSQADMREWMVSYSQGILTGKIDAGSVPAPAPPPPSSGCLYIKSHRDPSAPFSVAPTGTPRGALRPGGFSLNASLWFAYTPDWQSEANGSVLMARSKPSFNCPLGALLKKCPAKSTSLPKADVRCFAPGTRLQLRAAPAPSHNHGLLIVDPIFPAASREAVSDGAATRAQLYATLTQIRAGSASCAVASTSVSGAGGSLPFTVAELAHVVSRHAACMREWLHGEPVMEMLQLRPFTFHGDE